MRNQITEEIESRLRELSTRDPKAAMEYFDQQAGKYHRSGISLKERGEFMPPEDSFKLNRM